ncbi:3-oxo-tetronate kinase [Brachybacterium sacelli]|uniref:3-oxo-tetronate kinase n=1 Tax=Brachybacterium sacelli TaxID=173364 RepID=A0ABS4WYY3_9MICO|nr:3-oxo-tetronate kinase [Brachybacterium sacelli]MBP2381415.1 uncharacterized protein YgbK (DUF1537 family) [Brachybacterium sacelli]
MLGAVADDFTGATDLAMMLRASGHRVLVTIEDSELSPEQLRTVDAVVIALKTRTAPVAEAVARSRAALARLQRWGAEQFYVKYCSTFDSTDQGTIGPILDAALEMLHAPRSVVVPALPANGRRVREGYLYVGEDLLENSSMRHHPLTPMTRSRVADLLRPQSVHDVTEIHRGRIAGGEASLRTALDAADAPYIVLDTEDDEDLRTIGAAVADDVLVSGGSGLALGMPGPTASDEDWHAPDPGRRVVLCGSVSSRSLAQIEHASRNQPVHVIDVLAAADDTAAAAKQVSGWIEDQPQDAIPVVCAARSRDDILRPEERLDPAATVEAVIAAVAAQLVGSGRSAALIVAGGESSGAVVGALGATALRIGPEIAPGVCWSLTASGDRTVALALKSGNFGSTDLFTSAWEALR